MPPMVTRLILHGANPVGGQPEIITQDFYAIASSPGHLVNQPTHDGAGCQNHAKTTSKTGESTHGDSNI